MLGKIDLLHVSDLHIASKARRVGLVDFWPLLRSSAFNLLSKKGLAFQTTYDDRALAALIYFLHDRLMEPRERTPVLVSGDLSATGHREDLRAAYACVVEPPRFHSKDRLASQIGLSNLTAAILPGNHDRFNPIFGRYPYHPGCKNFDSIFQKEWPTPLVNATRLSPLGATKAVFVVAGDLCLRCRTDAVPPSFKNILGQGHAHIETCDLMVRTTQDLRLHNGGETEVLWSVHFPPMVSETDSVLRLVNDERLIAAARQANVRHILCGHTHKPRRIRVKGTADVLVHVAGTATADTEIERNSFYLHSLRSSTSGINLDTQSYRYSQRRAKFEPTDPPPVEDILLA